MSLQEPHRRQSANYSRTFLDQLHRSLQGSSRQTASFVEICDRASIPRDLRTTLLNTLLTEKYITRNGDQVSITPAGKTVATTPSL